MASPPHTDGAFLGGHTECTEYTEFIFEFTQTAQTHAEFLCLTQNAPNAQIFLRQKNRRTDLFLTQRRRGREAICSFVLMSKTAKEGTSGASKSL